MHEIEDGNEKGGKQGELAESGGGHGERGACGEHGEHGAQRKQGEHEGNGQKEIRENVDW